MNTESPFVRTEAGAAAEPHARIPRELLIVAGTAAAVALAMVFYGFRKQGLVSNAGDPYDYGKIAHGFVEHGFDKVTRRAAMLYPHLLAVIYWLGGSDFVVQLLHVLFHVGTTTLVFLLGRRLFNVRTALIAGLITALHPMLLRYVADLHTETLLAFMATLTVWCAVRFDEHSSVKNGILLGVVGMLAALGKGVFLPVVVAYGVVWGVRGLRRGAGRPNPIPGLIAMFVAMAVVVAPWTYRNYEVDGGRFVLLTPGMPDAFLRGYIFTQTEFITLEKPPYTDAENASNALFRRLAREAGTTWELDEVQDDVNNSKEMKRMIREHPFLTVRKVFVGLFTFWYEMTSRASSLVPFVLALVSWTLAVVGMKRAHREGRPYWLLLLPIVVLNVVVAILVPLGRYSVPVIPCLSLLAAFGVDTLIGRRKPKAGPDFALASERTA
jgi:4-amino-4-deoxy-L-arabinose transferase-like glycosyltransferase